MERKEIEDKAEKICAEFDKIYFDYLDKILEEVRSNNYTQQDLGRLAIQERETPKAP